MDDMRAIRTSWTPLKRVALGLGIGVVLAVGGWAVAQDKPAPTTARAPTAAPPPSKADPAGTATGAVGDISAKEAGKPTPAELADQVGHNKVSVNVMWTLLAGFLIMFMQAGFALVETGLTRAKNLAHTMMMNFMVYAVGMTGYWIMGFALQMGGVGARASLGGTGLLDSEFTISLFGKDFGLFGTKASSWLARGYDVAVFMVTV